MRVGKIKQRRSVARSTDAFPHFSTFVSPSLCLVLLTLRLTEADRRESRTLCRLDQVENRNIRTKTLYVCVCLQRTNRNFIGAGERKKKGKMYLLKHIICCFCFFYSIFFLSCRFPHRSALASRVKSSQPSVVVLFFFFASHLLFLVSRFHRSSLAPPPLPRPLRVSLNGRWSWKQVGHAVRDHTHTRG